MREKPSEPILVILTRPQNCSGCRESAKNRIERGWSFLGSDAVFCAECTGYLCAERTRSSYMAELMAGGDIETRRCEKCKKPFRAKISRGLNVCVKCRDYEKKVVSRSRLRLPTLS